MRNGTIVYNYRGHDIYRVGNEFSIKEFYFFKWRVLRDAKSHIDRHLGYPIPPHVPDQIISEIPTEVHTIDLKDIYNKIKTDIEKRELKSVTDNLLDLIGRCYEKDLIDVIFIENIKDNLDKLEKVIGYMASSNANEATIANEKSLDICGEILIMINDQAKIM